MKTTWLFRVFGNGTSRADSVDHSTAAALAKPSEFDGDYYSSRGGLTFAAFLYIDEGIPTFCPFDGFSRYDEVCGRLATEAAQEIFG